MEFLTTYCFAFLIILVMIGALAYLGILDTSSLNSDRCTYSSEVECSAFSLGRSDSGLSMPRLRL